MARWVLQGFTQHSNVDYDETLSPVVKPVTVRTILTLALSLEADMFTSWMLRTHSSITPSLRQYIVANPPS
jgi:hypothetical protein